jgi:molybdenum cofactor synthesis domain-containing protein
LFRASVLTISDSASRGQRKDSAGPLIAEFLTLTGRFTMVDREIVPDETDAISSALRKWCDSGSCDLIVTTGGTGLSPRDVTPEATLRVIEREIPGIAEAMRLEGLKNTRRAMLSRAVCGTRRETLIINLPGSPGGVRDGLSAISEVLEHAIKKIQGDVTPCNG